MCATQRLYGWQLSFDTVALNALLKECCRMSCAERSLFNIIAIRELDMLMCSCGSMR